MTYNVVETRIIINAVKAIFNNRNDLIIQKYMFYHSGLLVTSALSCSLVMIVRLL